MQMSKKSAHEFALYISDLDTSKETTVITDPQITHRIGVVLRLQPNDTLVLFNRSVHCNAQVTEVTKKHVSVNLSHIKDNTNYQPSITMLLPLLKKDAFEVALYACVELGVNTIQLIKTQKSAPVRFDKERCNRIIIAAAEQSKNFNFPELHEPCTLEEALQKTTEHTRIFADVSGGSLKEVITQKSDSFCLLVGPEGDLTNDEKELLKEHTFIFCHLTPTILRSPQAVTVLVGSIRSLTE